MTFSAIDNDMLSSLMAENMAAETAASANANVVLEGVVSNVFYNSNGYAIFGLSVNKGKPITVKGSIANIAKGMRVEASGRYVDDVKYKERQFSAKAITPSVSKLISGESSVLSNGDLDELASYLGSGFLPGVGDAVAKRIVAKFGRDTVKAIEGDALKLAAVRGINEERAQIIRQEWMKNVSAHSIFIFLSAHGLSLAKAKDILDTFSLSAAKLKEKITENPYIICEVDGVGFKTADSFAASMGIVGASEERVKSGIEYAFIEDIIKSEGSSGATIDQILKVSSALLGVSQAKVYPILEKMSETDRRLIVVGDIIYHRKYYEAERSIAKNIARLMSAGQPELPDLEDRIDRAEIAIGKGKWKLLESQRAALRALFSGNVAVLTGFPGTGKTTILSIYLHILSSCGKRYKNILQAAPSGMAAKRMQVATGFDASTCHRLLGFKNGSFDYDENNQLPADVLALDEWSMADILLTDSMLRATPTGCKLILLGDVDQLESIGPGRVFADMINSGRVTFARLTEICRQDKGSLISVAAKLINEGKIPTQFNENFSATVVKCVGEEGVAAAALIEVLDIIKSLPARGLSIRDIQVLCPMKKGECGTERINIEIQKIVNKNIDNPDLFIKSGDKLLAVGDRVIQTKNDYDLDIFNGDSGEIVHVDIEEKSIIVNFGDKTKPFNVSIPSNKLVRVELFYAGTVHKAQGSEFDYVIAPVISSHYVMLKRNIVYTNLTRGKKGVFMVVDEGMKSLQRAAKTEDANRRVTSLKDHLIDLCPKEVKRMDASAAEDESSDFFDDVPY